MTLGDAVALLDLLAARGIVAWLADGEVRDGAEVVVDVSGLDGATSLLIARGFVLTADELPAALDLAHPRHGRVRLRPAGFRPGGGATLHALDGSELRLDVQAFDPVATVPRRVRLDGQPPAED